MNTFAASYFFLSIYRLYKAFYKRRKLYAESLTVDTIMECRRIIYQGRGRSKNHIKRVIVDSSRST